MLASLPAPRSDLSKYAPRIQTIQIDPEKIGLLIGPGGKTIRRITETTGAQIDIAEDDSGKVFIYSNNGDAMARADQGDRRPLRRRRPDRDGQDLHRPGDRREGLRLLRRVHPGKEGLCHISELADFRVRRTEDVVKEGDTITVKCIGIDEAPARSA